MRQTYTSQRYTFARESSAASQSVKRIVVHRQGNPGARAINSLDWGNRTGAYTIHYYVEDGTVYRAIPENKHAFHVREARKAQAEGYRVTGAYGTRGDYDSIGIETVDLPGGGPGQSYHLSQETRISLVPLLAEIVQRHGLSVDRIEEHAHWDPWTRPEDLGNALYIPDLRLDVQDQIEGRTPWRTVQAHAFGRAAPSSWKPSPQTPPAPPQRPVDLSGVSEAITTAETALQDAKKRLQQVAQQLTERTP